MANLLRPVDLLLGDAITYRLDLTEDQIERGNSCLNRVGHQIEALVHDELTPEDRGIVEAATTTIALVRQLYATEVSLNDAKINERHVQNLQLLESPQERIQESEPSLDEESSHAVQVEIPQSDQVDCWNQLIGLVNRVVAYVQEVWASIVNLCKAEPSSIKATPQSVQPEKVPEQMNLAPIEEPLFKRDPFQHGNIRLQLWNMAIRRVEDRFITVLTALQAMREKVYNRMSVTEAIAQAEIVAPANLKIDQFKDLPFADLVEKLSDFGFESKGLDRIQIAPPPSEDAKAEQIHLRTQVESILNSVLAKPENLDEEGFASIVLLTDQTCCGLFYDPISERYYIIRPKVNHGESTLVQVLQSVKDAASVLAHSIGVGNLTIRILNPSHQEQD